MTVSAILLRDRFFHAGLSSRFKYKTLALLFVNISIGGVLTHFAAPPVVMVAKIWQWDTPFMFHTFGYKALLAVIANTMLTFFFVRREFRSSPNRRESQLRSTASTLGYGSPLRFSFSRRVYRTSRRPGTVSFFFS